MRHKTETCYKVGHLKATYFCGLCIDDLTDTELDDVAQVNEWDLDGEVIEFECFGCGAEYRIG